MMMTASATAPSPSSPPNMTSGRNHSRRHQRSASGSSFSFSNERGLGAFTPLSGLPRRSRSVHHPEDADSTPREMPISASPPSARSLSASTTPRASVGLTTPVSPSRVKKASFSFGSSSDDEEDDDCPLVREVNQRARLAKSPTEVDHFGDFSFDAEAHKAKSARLTTTQEADTETETETEADFPPTPVGDAAPAPRLTISTNIPPAVVPFPALSPSPERSALPLPPLSIPDAPVGSPVVRSASSPFLSSPPPKPDAKQGPGLRIGIPSSASSTSPYNSGTSTPIMLKNGRPLKPSLKSRVNLSLSTPDVASMLSHSKSAPGTPRVHFPTRERLESVVLFDKRARPLEVAAGDSPLASPRGFFDDTPGFRMRPQSSFPFPSVSPRGSPMGSTANLQGLSAAIMAKTKLKIAISRSAPLQPIPRPEANVHLAAMRLLSTRLTGSVLVKNVSFSKKVMIRYTFDHWETTMEVSGMWSSPDALNDLPAGSVKAPGNEETERDIARAILVPAPSGYDRFVFNIKLDDVAPYLSKRPMLLAVKFEAAGVGEWWDNCGGLNYRFEFDHVPKPEAPKVDSAPVTPPVTFGRPRSNTSPAPLNMDATHTQTDLPSATLLSAKLNSVVEKQAPEPVELPVARPNLKLTFPSDETITTVPADLTADLGAELAAPKATAIGVPTAKKQVTTLTPPDSTSSSPREVPVALPPPSAPAASLPSPAESPASRRQSSPLPSPSAIDAPAHSTTNVKDQSYADFIAKYCFAGASAAAPTVSAAAPAPNFGSSFGAPPQSNTGNPSWGSPTPNFGWGSTAPSHQPWGGVGFQYGRSTQSYTGGDL